jgi:hypothetical protein
MVTIAGGANTRADLSEPRQQPYGSKAGTTGPALTDARREEVGEVRALLRQRFGLGLR